MNLTNIRFSTWLESLYQQKAYHGTNKVFRDFSKEFFGQRDWGDFGVGIYLTESKYLAMQYANDAARVTGEPIVLSVRLLISNVANFDDEFASQLSQSINIPFPKIIVAGERQTRPRDEAQKITNYMISNNYDAATARHGKEIVVYDPSKLRIEGYYDKEEDYHQI
jgi:hypothetical protein